MQHQDFHVSSRNVLMMRLISLTLLLAGVIGLATAQGTDAQILSLRRGNESVQIPFSEDHDILMNDRCSRNLLECEAYQVSEKISEGKLHAKNINGQKGNPASVFCKELGGISLTLKDNHSNDVAICAFKDKTMASAWDLFNVQKSREK